MKSLSCLEGFLVVSELLDRVENDEDLLLELFVLFQEDVPGSRAALLSAVEASDFSGVEKAAHRIKGMLANLSAREAASLAAAMESAARAGDSARVQEILSAFDPQLAGISQAVDAFMTEVES